MPRSRGLALTLLVLRVIADDANYTVATNHFAVAANLLNRSTNFHDLNSVYGRPGDRPHIV